MSNGFTTCTLVTVFVAVSFLTGCARDRAVGHASLATTQLKHVAAATGGVGQKLCPVTGEPLESMGGAIPVTVKGETIKVCCQGCVKAVNKDPDKYLAIVHAEQQ